MTEKTTTAKIISALRGAGAGLPASPAGAAASSAPARGRRHGKGRAVGRGAAVRWSLGALTVAALALLAGPHSAPALADTAALASQTATFTSSGHTHAGPPDSGHTHAAGTGGWHRVRNSHDVPPPPLQA